MILCLIQGFVHGVELGNPQALFQGWSFGDLVINKEYIWWYRIQTVLLLTTGTMLLMWLGEQITERGIGNGFRCHHDRHRSQHAGGRWTIEGNVLARSRD